MDKTVMVEPEMDAATSALWEAELNKFEKKGGYAASLKPSKEQVELIREDQRIDHLAENFRLWIEDLFGSFDIRQMYTDLGVTTPQDKVLLRVALHRLVADGILERGRLMGTYRKIDAEADSIGLLEEEPVPIPIKLPGGIEEYVDIFPGNIIVNAGSPNAGKSAYDLNCAIQNCDDFEVIYFSSEMGPEELTLRTSKFDIPKNEWKKIQFKKRVENFQDVVQPDALNIVDYLEVIEGEFYKIGDHIRKIYQKLDRGIAMISLQMDRGAKFAWGGQKTLDKARVYLTLDAGVLTLQKGKNRSSTVNPDGLSRSFKLISGCEFRWEPWQSKA